MLVQSHVSLLNCFVSNGETIKASNPNREELTLSSTNTLPFFFPFGLVTPTGVTMLSSGTRPASSFSLYFLFFCFLAISSLISGRPLLAVTRVWVLLLGFPFDFRTPSFLDLSASLLPLMPDLFAACLFFIVFVGAIVCYDLDFDTVEEKLVRRCVESVDGWGGNGVGILSNVSCTSSLHFGRLLWGKIWDRNLVPCLILSLLT